MNKLNLTGKKSKISLLTMSPVTTTSTYMVNDLQISSLDGVEFYDLPVVYTQKQMPVNEANIVKKEDIAPWTYLCQVDLPVIDAGVDLLIGMDASKLHKPWEVVNRQCEGPYATKTLLGWVVGGSSECCEKLDAQHTFSTVSRSSAVTIGGFIEKRCMHDVKCLNQQEKEKDSQDDKVPPQITEKSVKFENCHCSLKLPLKNIDPTNKTVAQQCLNGPKRKMEQNEKWKKQDEDKVSETFVKCKTKQLSEEKEWCAEAVAAKEPVMKNAEKRNVKCSDCDLFVRNVKVKKTKVKYKLEENVEIKHKVQQKCSN